MRLEVLVKDVFPPIDSDQLRLVLIIANEETVDSHSSDKSNQKRIATNIIHPLMLSHRNLFQISRHCSKS